MEILTIYNRKTSFVEEIIIFTDNKSQLFVLVAYINSLNGMLISTWFTNSIIRSKKGLKEIGCARPVPSTQFLG